MQGINDQTRAGHLEQARRFIAAFDKNGDGQLTRGEFERGMYTRQTSRDDRDGDWMIYTPLTQAYFSRINQSWIDRVIANPVDGVTAEDIVDAYDARLDRNGDGKLSRWERMLARFKGMAGFLGQATTEFYIETEGRPERHYAPLPPRTP